jgi:hypothetical protein
MIPIFIAKFLTKWDVAKAASTIHGFLGFIVFPVNKASIIADRLEKQFAERDLCDSDHRRHVEAQVEGLLATIY